MNNNGFVQLPLDVYDNMQDSITRLQNELDHSIAKTKYDELSEVLSNIVIIRDYYGDAKPLLSINIEVLTPWIEDALLNSDYGDDYELRESTSCSNTLSTTSCFIPIVNEDQA